MPGLIWRGLYLDDNRVFYGQEDVYTPNFTVDIMLDAPASRGEYQRVIAAQAYVIAEALRACGIPYQIYSFCTLRGYTVMTLYQSYEEKKKARVFLAIVPRAGTGTVLPCAAPASSWGPDRCQKSLSC